ncbi:pectin lyase-like protein [Rhizodiscina lignyota]|uniref:galacturonan 1,4-alpha-galacturonidase n=1 Tax=Rhizodiscina lignyota TaxID=1504668 RepID=A0A9P4IGA5_9PEZI|nr:pectin lyase-like protein [Rhizodiscina lignyota]
MFSSISNLLLPCVLSSLFVILVSSTSPPSYSKSCVIPSKYSSSNGTADDSSAIATAFAECSTDAVITFSEGVNYNVYQPISAKNLSNVVIEIYGNLHLPQNISVVQTYVNATSTGTLYWLTFWGPSINFVGTANISNGWINSYGQGWWDANAVNGTGTAARPHLLSFNTTNGSMQHYKSRKPIAWNVQLIGENITVTDTFIDAYSVSGSFPFNTDGFDVTGTNINIFNSIIYNGDDAIAVQSGSHGVLFQGGTIGYQTHGMSIGSLGQNQASFANVTDIHFDDITVVNGVYASRFKSWEGGQGLAKNVTWSNIRAYNVTFPIFVTQTYLNQGSNQTQLENGATSGRPNNATVNMEDFTWANFTGTINTFMPGDGSCVSDPCWYNVGLPNLQHTEAIIIECNTNVSCKSFVLENIELIPQSLDAPTMVCINATSSLNPGLGVDCVNGTYTS